MNCYVIAYVIAHIRADVISGKETVFKLFVSSPKLVGQYEKIFARDATENTENL